ncbi:Aste57867_16468 [Aphanomyces stellatus]|uniref:Aste57867_16468 protein n=1 Tax=Aphanomyces stellatus TaxID=120398 RepID=A0A485L5V6_9STRA|nr:hypothetical protein As57867_016411 [Aphanomyces stellatus]VFT93242.1 Aste57867_16468 [Aphanomyces stellatus]
MLAAQSFSYLHAGHNHNQHAGELYVQRRRHVPREVSSIPPQIISDEMPYQHSSFFSHLPYFAITTLDGHGRPWATIVSGPPSAPPVRAVSDTELHVRSQLAPDDPFGAACVATKDANTTRLWAGLGVDFTNRRRNKVAGVVTSSSFDATTGALAATLTTNDNMGNCPKYITLRDLVYDARAATPETIANSFHDDVTSDPAAATTTLTDDEIALVHRASTLFLASRHLDPDDAASTDVGLNHRGGPRGFARVGDGGRAIYLPDFSGNRFYQSLGNIQTDHVAGLVIPCFETGDMLHVTGVAENLYDDDASQLMPRVTLVTRVVLTGKVYIRKALPFTLRSPERYSPYNPPVRLLATELEAQGKLPTATTTTTNVATLVDIRRVTDRIAAFTFELTEAVRHVPGGFAIFDFSALFDRSYRHMFEGNPQQLNDDYVRTWTISSSPPWDGTAFGPTTRLTCTIKHVARGAVSSLLHTRAKRGFSVPLLGVGGEFSPWAATPSPPTKMLWVAAGVGVTPFLAFAQALAASHTTNVDVVVLLAARGEEARIGQLLAGVAGLSKLKIFDSTGTASLPSPSAEVVPRRMTALDFAGYEDRTAYICGPSDFMASAQAMMDAAGIEHVHKESFAF